MNIVVPDASVLLKWVLREEEETHLEEAVALRNAFVARRCRLLVPSLWIYEVGNILALKQPRFAQPALDALLAMEFDVGEINELYLAKAFELVKGFKVSFYDAAYHALAIVKDGVFVTADENYLKKTAKSSHSMALREWR